MPLARTLQAKIQMFTTSITILFKIIKTLASVQLFYRAAAWKKLGVILINQKNQVSTLKKNLGRCYPKKSQVAPYKFFGIFYRVPFKSPLRVQIKRVNVKIWLIKKLDRIFDAWKIARCLKTFQLA